MPGFVPAWIELITRFEVGADLLTMTERNLQGRCQNLFLSIFATQMINLALFSTCEKCMHLTSSYFKIESKGASVHYTTSCWWRKNASKMQKPTLLALFWKKLDPVIYLLMHYHQTFNANLAGIIFHCAGQEKPMRFPEKPTWSLVLPSD